MTDSDKCPNCGGSLHDSALGLDGVAAECLRRQLAQERERNEAAARLVLEAWVDQDAATERAERAEAAKAAYKETSEKAQAACAVVLRKIQREIEASANGKNCGSPFWQTLGIDLHIGSWSAGQRLLDELARLREGLREMTRAFNLEVAHSSHGEEEVARLRAVVERHVPLTADGIYPEWGQELFHPDLLEAGCPRLIWDGHPELTNSDPGNLGHAVKDLYSTRAAAEAAKEKT